MPQDFEGSAALTSIVARPVMQAELQALPLFQALKSCRLKALDEEERLLDLSPLKGLPGLASLELDAGLPAS